jgi:hypothetical protein
MYTPPAGQSSLNPVAQKRFRRFPEDDAFFRKKEERPEVACAYF